MRECLYSFFDEWRNSREGITRRDLSRYQLQRGDKSTYKKAVRTMHQDKKNGKLKIVDLGNENSPDDLRPVHTDLHNRPPNSIAAP